MRPRILLINPPIYDFSAYDFWLKPYGMLRVAGFLRGSIDSMSGCRRVVIGRPLRHSRTLLGVVGSTVLTTGGIRTGAPINTFAGDDLGMRIFDRKLPF